MKTTIKIYQNKLNKNKYIEVHNDGYHHNAVRQYMHWYYREGEFSPDIPDRVYECLNFTGDGYLHRWRTEKLKELLEDYIFVTQFKGRNRIREFTRIGNKIYNR